ncbi:l-ascorbate oxidase [Quercus suber]|uniref:L-ascorbate oxidase n=1 Tax=Quercus suber TaxID=58331 RepID=A0AAW0MAQ9_QUESU
MVLKLLSSCLFICLIYVPLAVARIRYHKWEVKYELKSPDCYKKLVITINGGSPGPPSLPNKAGTNVYHAHYGMQIGARLYGSIRVSLPDGVSEPFAYGYDRSIILTDWYHKSISEQAVGLSSIPFVWVGEPQSLLIQGKGKFDCTSVSSPAGVCNASNPECSPYSITVIPGKTYRLRVASLTGCHPLVFK